MPIPDCDPQQVQKDLLAQYGIEIPVFRWQDRCIARVSAQGYNTAAQMDHLVAALSQRLSLSDAA